MYYLYIKQYKTVFLWKKQFYHFYLRDFIVYLNGDRRYLEFNIL